MDSDVLLSLNNIRKEYPGVMALHDVNLSFREGEVHAICGENGAGKSTLIKIVTGAIQPSSGTIQYLGQEIRHQDPVSSRNAGISCIYQEFNLIPELSVAENVFFGREIMSHGFVDYKAMYERTQTLIDDLGIRIDPRTPVKNLTVGFQQIVEIAKSLSQDVRVLIMDEPSAPLTNSELEHLFRIVKKLREQKVTVIYISHRLEEVFELADRVSVIRDGEYMGTRDIRDTNNEDLISLMVGRSIGNDYPKRTSSPGETILRVENLNTSVLRDISFDLKKGEILGLAGLVGAGRTETARAIFGADPLDSGRIILYGKETRIKDPADAIRRGIGLIPEDRKRHGILGELSILENMSFASLKQFLRGFLINRKKERESVAILKDRLRVKAPNLQVSVKALSGGNQQKVVLAKSLMTETDILIFDEPTRGIDVGAKQEIYQLMNELVSAGTSIIMISSEMPELIGMSDRILVLCEGELVAELGPQQFHQETILKYASGVENVHK